MFAFSLTFAGSNGSLAQSLGGEGGLGTLLEQLQTLQSQGALQSATGGQSGALDTARQLRPGESTTSPLGPRSRLDLIREQELIRQIEVARKSIVNSYCENGVLPAEGGVARIDSLLSPLEQDYCRRAAEPLLQFGYGIFSGSPVTKTPFAGAIQDDYLLGIGDEIVVTFHGQTQGTFTVRVDREGRVVIGDLPPIPVAGKTFGEMRRALEARVAASMFGTDIFVSLGSVRAISVVVVGEVQQPGVKSLTSQSTVIDALTLASGVKKTGSLRKIQVFRNDSIFWVDVYELLLGIGLSDRLSLIDGDRVVVPTIGSTVAIAGQVKRPAIYEMVEGHSEISISELVALSGGTLRPSGSMFTQISFDPAGRETISDHVSAEGTARDGDVIHVKLSQDVQLNTVELLGHARVQGRRALSTTATLRALVDNAERLKPDPYLLFSILETSDPNTKSRRLFPVNLQSILAGTQDYALRDQDRLIVLGKSDIRYLMSNDVQQVLQFGLVVQEVEEPGGSQRRPQTPAPSELGSAVESSGNPVQQVLADLGIGQPTPQTTKPADDDGQEDTENRAEGRFACRGLQTLATIVSTTRSGRFAHAIRAIGLDGSAAPLVNPLPCPPIFELFPELLPFLLEHVVAVDGEVRIPGAYPLINETPLSSVVAVTGGLTRDADLRNVELTRFTTDAATGATPGVRQVVNLVEQGFENVTIHSGDVIRFNRTFTDRDSGPVLLSGEFVRPGLFDIRRGERLSEVISRAGGLTAQAYPYGAVFTRERVKKAQQAGFQRAARELNSAAVFASAKKGIDPLAVIALQEITKDLNALEAVGRMVIEADPTVLQVRPEFDTVLEPGDRLFIPKRPNSVLVIGDVLNPGALQFISGQKADAYIRQAGGFQQSADQDRVFIVYPNGAAQPVSVSVWNYNPLQVPPGSTIVAPKNPAPLDIFTFAKDISQLISQVAITAGSLAVLSNNN